MNAPVVESNARSTVENPTYEKPSNFFFSKITYYVNHPFSQATDAYLYLPLDE
jgi:hypothetical protein